MTASPNQSFMAKAGNILFCLACSPEVSLKLSRPNTSRGARSVNWESLSLESWNRRNGDTIDSIHDSLTEYRFKLSVVSLNLLDKLLRFQLGPTVSKSAVFAGAGIAINKLANPALLRLLEVDRSSLGTFQACRPCAMS